MVESIMGKIIGHNKTLVLIMFLFMLVLLSATSMAAFQEDDLFEKAYEYYLSYHPEKALEYFDIFLYSFPDSSAKDAVFFWKAKSLMQLKRTDEAIKIFSSIKNEFPESPFITFIEKELSAFKSDSYASRNYDLPAEKETITNEAGLTALEEESKKERNRMAGLTGKGDKADMLAKELRESEETKKKLQKQVAQYNEQISLREKEKETLLAKLKDTEESVKNSAASLQKVREDYASAKRAHDLVSAREKYIISEITLMKDMIKQYEIPIVKLGENQFSLKQILDDYRVSSEVMKKIKANNIWRHDNPYNDFIIEQALLIRANKSGIKEDRDLYNSLLVKYSLNEGEKGYLVRYLTIHNLVIKKLPEIVSDDNYIRRYYEINKERYFINTTKKQIKMLSLNYSQKDEQEKILVALNFHREVASGKTFESVYKSNSNVLSLDTVDVSKLSEFIQDRIDGMKDGEISSVISHGNKFVILQVQFTKPGYRSYEAVYKEIQEKIYDDQTLQANLLQEWFDELRKEAELIK